MQLVGDKYHPGGQYLQRRQFTRFHTMYPWDYWIGVSLWTGEWVYLKNGEDFSCSTRNFRNAVSSASKTRKVLYKATYRRLPKDEIKVVWYQEGTFAPPVDDEPDPYLAESANFELPDFLRQRD